MAHKIYKFDQLSNLLMYQILALRQAVFVVEQRSIYSDLDFLDQQAMHLCEFDEKQQLIGYLRYRVEQQAVAKIERVVVAKTARGRGLAAAMMDAAMEQLRQDNQVKEVKLSAQLAVLSFYQRWQFEVCSEIYDDGGIDHQDMRVVL